LFSQRHGTSSKVRRLLFGTGGVASVAWDTKNNIIKFSIQIVQHF
jgi:hypothetical protein